MAPPRRRAFGGCVEAALLAAHPRTPAVCLSSLIPETSERSWPDFCRFAYLSFGMRFAEVFARSRS